MIELIAVFYEFMYLDNTVNMDIITDMLSHLFADVVSMKEEVKHYLAVGVLSSLIDGEDCSDR